MDFIKVATLVALLCLVSNNVNGKELSQEDIDSILKDGGIILSPEYVYFPFRLSFEGAKQRCKNNNFRLPSILTEEQFSELATLLGVHFVREAWTSGAYSTVKRHFVWTSESTLPEIKYEGPDIFPYWALPPTATSGCVMLKNDFSPGGPGYEMYVELKCQLAKNVVCQVS